MRKFWITLLLLSVCLMAIVSPVGVIGDDDEDDDDDETTTGGFILKVDPPLHTVHLNKESKNATYAVRVMALDGFEDEIELHVKGLPDSSEAIFTPDEGVPDPVFTSILRVEVSLSTPPGAYTLTIVAVGEGENGEDGEDGGDTFLKATTMLVVQGEVFTTIQRVQNRLQVTLMTSQENYQKGAEVDILGHVGVRLGESTADATVSIAVVNPKGQEIHVRSMKTDQVGRFSDNFTLSQTAEEGTYVVYVTAGLSPYKDGLGRTTFTVGSSDVPSVLVTNITVTLVDGTTPVEFYAGQTVVVWVAVNNSGADLENGMVWVEIIDSNNVPVAVVAVIVTIHHGEQVTAGLQIALRSDAPTGIYVVRALVSDGLITKGGKFLDSEEIGFVVA